jgi:hypothetical protein
MKAKTLKFEPPHVGSYNSKTCTKDFQTKQNWSSALRSLSPIAHFPEDVVLKPKLLSRKVWAWLVVPPFTSM